MGVPLGSYTLTEIRQRAAQEFGPCYFGTAKTGSTASYLYDSTWPITSTIDTDDLYVDQYLFRPNAALASDKVRIVKNYIPLQGFLQPDGPWINPPANNEPYELHGVIEPGTDLLTLINQGLMRCFVVTEFSFTPVANQNRHQITQFAPYVTNPRWVRSVGYLSISELRDQTDPYMRAVRGDAIELATSTGMVIYLQHPGMIFDPNSSTVYVRCIAPSYTQCSGATFPQNGLTLETDSAPINLEWAASSVLQEAWRKYSHLLEPAANQRIIRDRNEAALWFSDLSARSFQLPPNDFRPLTRWGFPARNAGPALWGPA